MSANLETSGSTSLVKLADKGGEVAINLLLSVVLLGSPVGALLGVAHPVGTRRSNRIEPTMQMNFTSIALYLSIGAKEVQESNPTVELTRRHETGLRTSCR